DRARLTQRQRTRTAPGAAGAKHAATLTTPEAWHLLGGRAMPDYDEMSPKALEKAAAKTDDPEELVSIAGAFLGHGDTARATAMCERANAIRPTERAYWMIGELARGDRRHADAAAA